ncbi:hypothetical protein D0864_05961 [Hortaea werneckii]|uniref:Glucose-methanol-choline oxidoreductase N-terminal domain-containing protein n=1 Tax=Hortaea werneckii TaxID=91943 RepID=A0A3M7FTA1_HORWE|nr:hypothetical protein D0864_05961 [Hortaea werneckii]
MLIQFVQIAALLAVLKTAHGSPTTRFAPHAIVHHHPSHLHPEYDYVNIGGGTSGLTVANRLTEDPRVSVLVIEYGYLDNEEAGTTLPGLPVPDKYVRTEESVPQIGLNGRTSQFKTGAVVGGMFFNRGSAEDYDSWEELGNPGWGWKDLLPYFKKSETFTPPSLQIANEYADIISPDLAPHGTNGPQEPKSNVKASREIILAAGAPYSPQILQLSGIGPGNLLEELGIETIVDLPGVGSNFQDQPTMFMQYTYSNYPYPSPEWLTTNETWTNEQLSLYYHNRTGPMTVPFFSGTLVAYLPLQNMTDESDRILHTASRVNTSSLLPINSDSTVLAGYHAQTQILLDRYRSAHTTVQEVAFGGSGSVPVALLKPLSRGSIQINTTDPSKTPLVDFGTFSHPTDLEIAVEAIKKTREFMSSVPMQETGATEIIRGANVTSDDEIAAAIRNFARSTWQHPTSSCSMMRRELGGVVDPSLKVYGVQGLRVVDASIMPLIIGSHTSSTVYAVAEKAADIIKAAQKH